MNTDLHTIKVPKLLWREDPQPENAGGRIGYLEGFEGTSYFLISPADDGVRMVGAFIPDRSDGAFYPTERLAKATADDYLRLFWRMHFPDSSNREESVGRLQALFVAAVKPILVAAHTKEQLDVFRRTFQLEPRNVKRVRDVYSVANRDRNGVALVLLPSWERSFTHPLELAEFIKAREWHPVTLTEAEVRGDHE